MRNHHQTRLLTGVRGSWRFREGGRTDPFGLIQAVTAADDDIEY